MWTLFCFALQLTLEGVYSLLQGACPTQMLKIRVCSRGFDFQLEKSLEFLSPS